ncbi:mechanosensitive ion channel family protein [Nissabacter sp. SGAir0207]|uniref:mechanosensitive ion channel family protein n=1 Tax=Nissabacter sp. SGAir0207 TaxID=2126321 RepID=UPI0010CD4EB2|nr:mechanosensitive ion channel family protein [Nissabacter sp. SGAir0207]QCR35586.1 mechanosensitive ion channel protein MscS [Nissabacter sp. SGAir0207]
METLQNINYIGLFLTLPFWVDVLLVLGITIVTYWVITRIIRLVHKRMLAWANEKQNNANLIISEVIGKTKKLLILVAAFLFSLRFVPIPDRLYGTLSHAWFLVLAIQIAIWLDQAIQSWLKKLIYSPGSRRNPVTLVIMGVIMRTLVWAIMVLSILANAGVDITALMASLGVGGIAIALAVQTVLSDMFASLSIGFDKPFEIGDFVIFNNVSGTIEHIGLKTTRIRSLSGEQIVCANTILLQQTIHNYKRMQTRRIVFTFGVSIDTPPEKLRKIGALLKKIIQDVGGTRFDRAHFSAFSPDRLTFEVVHIVNTADYNQYMDLQQEINIRLIEELDKMGVRLALPSQIMITPEKPEQQAA